MAMGIDNNPQGYVGPQQGGMGYYNPSIGSGQSGGDQSSLWSSILGNSSLMGTVGNIAGGLMSQHGYENATDAQNAGIQRMIGQQGGVYQNIAGMYNPYRTEGAGASSDLMRALGLNGTAPNFSQFYNSPGYQFQLGQGTQAINRQASANGSLYTPQTMNAVGSYAQGLAGTTYQNYINNLLQTAGQGLQATQGTANAGLVTGNNIGQGLVQQGASSAGGALGAGGAMGNLLGGIFGNGNSNSGLINQLQQAYKMYNQGSSLYNDASSIFGGASTASDITDTSMADAIFPSSAGGEAAGGGLLGGGAGAGGAGAGAAGAEGAFGTTASAGYGGEMAGGMMDMPLGAGAGADAAAGGGAAAGGDAAAAGAGSFAYAALPIAVAAFGASRQPYTLTSDYWNRLKSGLTQGTSGNATYDKYDSPDLQKWMAQNSLYRQLQAGPTHNDFGQAGPGLPSDIMALAKQYGMINANGSINKNWKPRPIPGFSNPTNGAAHPGYGGSGSSAGGGGGGGGRGVASD